MEAVTFESNLTIDRIQDLIIAYEFTSDVMYQSIFTRKDTFKRILGNGGYLALALLEDKTIIGFAALNYPRSDERWANIGGKIVMELKAVEVLPEFRNRKIAWHLLSLLFSDPGLEQKILYLVSYTWIWDLVHTGLSTQSYRDVLINLYARFGFEKSLTNEPNVCLKPENVFMVRIGNEVLPKHCEAFKWLRFGLKEELTFQAATSGNYKNE